VMLIAGATPSGLNGEKRVMSVVGNTFTFDAVGVADGTATGSITCKVAAAGWQKVFSGTNKAVYRSTEATGTQTYLRVDDSHAQYARPLGYLTMSDVDTGTGVFGSDAYWNRTNATAGSRPWWVVANKTMVYFGIKTHGVTTTDGFAICAFGDLIPRRSGDPYRCVVSGASAPASNWGSAHTDMNPSIKHVSAGFSIARSYTQLGGGVLVAPRILGTGACASGEGAVIPFPNGGDNSVVLCDGLVGEHTTNCLRGKLPGLYFSPQRPHGALLNDFEITGAADFPSKTLLWKLTGSASAGSWGGCAIDITGPWE